MADPQGYRIEAFEPKELASGQLREAALFEQALQHERVPEDPLMDPVAIEARFRASAPGQWRAFIGARDRTGAIGGHCVLPNIEILDRLEDSPVLDAIRWSNAEKLARNDALADEQRPAAAAS